MITEKPLDCWAEAKLGMNRGSLNRETLHRYQTARLSETIRFAAANSSYYRKSLGRFAACGISSLSDVAYLPFTTEEVLRERGPELLCVSQSRISRVVTLNTSGTIGEAKRLWFTPADQASTMDFFCAGMTSLVGRDNTVLVLLPGNLPGSVGDLLARALKNMGVAVISHGPVRSLDETLRVMRDAQVDSIVGTPVQVLALARYSLDCGCSTLRLKNVLLSTDYAARSLVREVERIWECEVFDHYGMTEMGLGGGVECAAHTGYHLREADLYFEIIDPETGEPLPEGCSGEVVFSTLTRQGMPLIRYRTGDISRFLPGACACGSVLKRLDRIKCRRDSGIRLPGAAEVCLSEFDEALFTVPGIIDFFVTVGNNRRCVQIELSIVKIGDENVTEADIFAKLDKISQVAAARRAGQLEITIRSTPYGGKIPSAAGKRIIGKSEVI